MVSLNRSNFQLVQVNTWVALANPVFTLAHIESTKSMNPAETGGVGIALMVLAGLLLIGGGTFLAVRQRRMPSPRPSFTVCVVLLRASWRVGGCRPLQLRHFWLCVWPLFVEDTTQNCITRPRTPNPSWCTTPTTSCCAKSQHPPPGRLRHRLRSCDCASLRAG